jgi:hypothetical protein
MLQLPQAFAEFLQPSLQVLDLKPQGTGPLAGCLAGGRLELAAQLFEALGMSGCHVPLTL